MRLISRAKGRGDALDDLSNGGLDLAIGFFPELDRTFLHRSLFVQDYVIVSRPGILIGSDCTLDDYTAAQHVIVSPAGELRGVVDNSLAQYGLTREVVLSVPLFFPALIAVQQAPLITTLPRRFASHFAATLGLELREPPLPIRQFEVRSVRHVRDKNNPMIDWIETQITEDCERL